MTLRQIKKFENLNNISINVYSLEKKKKWWFFLYGLLIWRETSQFSLYMQNPQNNNRGTFCVDQEPVPCKVATQ